MKKKILSIALILVLTAGILGACDAGKGVAVNTPPQSAATEAAASSSIIGPNGETQPAEPVGTLDDYVATAKEAEQSFSDGSVKTYRLPEILLDSSDAATANSEIMSRFGDDCKTYDDYSPVISMDYEAYLNDAILSVTVIGRYDGGNSYGLCYSFDVTTGSRLDNEALCFLTGRDFNNALDTFRTNLTSYYDEKYAMLGGNDEMRAKTLADDNIASAVMYLGSTGKLVVFTEIYAAVGGGHWVDTISAE